MSATVRDPASVGRPGDRPEWLDTMWARLTTDPPDYFRMFAPPADPPRQGAVLILFTRHTSGGEAVVLTERSQALRSHAGQVSFPGGSIDPGDTGPVGAALREANEEIGLDPATVDVLGPLPALYLSPSRFAVTPVLGWWREPGPIGAVDEFEVARVAEVPVADLLDPASRFMAVHPRGWEGPAFEADGLFVWGFTALLLNGLFEAAGLAADWDREQRRAIPDEVLPKHERGGQP